MGFTMALTIDVTFKGIPVADAYVSLSGLVIDDGKQAQSFTAVYRSARGTEVFQCINYSTPYDLDGLNPYIQAYEYLKTLPEFEGALDC